MQLVKDIMVTNVIKISPYDSLRDALKLMKDKKVKSLIVEKQNPHDAYGIITQTSLLKTIVSEEGDIDLLNVYDICTKPVLSVPKEMDVKYVARMMVNQNIGRVIVLNGNELEGIISMKDIIDVILHMVE